MTRQRVPTPADVIAAADRLKGAAVVTPMHTNAALDAALGGRVLLKPEVLQHAGSFKFRGAYNRLVQLSADQRTRGVVAFSSGNHAQGVAYAAQILNMPAAIVMPVDAPRIKIDNTRRFGAEVFFYDRMTDNREEMTARIATARGAVVVPAFNDPDIIAGQGTIALELADAAAAAGLVIDQVLICCGGGGMTAGIALGFEARGLSPDIYTVEPEGFDDTARSLAEGRIVTNARLSGSICDALLAPAPGELTFAVNRTRVKAGLTVSDGEAAAAVAFAFDKLKLVVEPGGAVALAAALSGKVTTAGRTTAVILSGGNVDAGMFSRCLADAGAA